MVAPNRDHENKPNTVQLPQASFARLPLPMMQMLCIPAGRADTPRSDRRPLARLHKRTSLYSWSNHFSPAFSKCCSRCLAAHLHLPFHRLAQPMVRFGCMEIHHVTSFGAITSPAVDFKHSEKFFVLHRFILSRLHGRWACDRSTNLRSTLPSLRAGHSDTGL
jgi:hypothetical protein